MPDPVLFPSEAEFPAHDNPGDFERPLVATDVVVLTVHSGELHTLLVRRSQFPDKPRWMLPGGLVTIDEHLDAAAARMLRDNGGLTGALLEQLYTFGQSDRDPRMRVITVAYLALIPASCLQGAVGSMCAVQVPWSAQEGGPAGASLNGVPLSMAPDLADILGLAVQRLRGRLGYSPVAYALLPETFTLRALQQVHEAILGHRLNKPSFRRRVLASGELLPTGCRETDASHRPAELYRCTADP
jgi:8-oxo-dGTP diphosphatase